MVPRRLGVDGPKVSPVGLGAMLLSIAGRPPEAQAIRVVHAALDAGITFIDSADAYCLDESEFNHNERLLAKALAQRPSNDVIVATKCACRRPSGAWTVDARPEYLIEAAHASLRALGVDALDLLQLHAPDSRVPFEESVGALADLRRQGKVRHVGLSNVSVQEIAQARRIVPIASVQNRYNLMARQAETDGIVDYCTKNGIAFIAYSPFGGSRLAPTLGTLGQLAALAKRRRVSPYRLAIAWLLAKSPNVIPIPGARRPESITDSTRGVGIELGEADLREIEAAVS